MTELRADVTLCIPAWQAAAFIDRTLACARAQTWSALRILVSVDQSDDDTAARCRAQATDDARIEVIEQRERLGWSRNCNALLDRVDTEFFCFYFHDDLIEPQFVAALRDALQAQPQAMSANCDVAYFGHREYVQTGHAYAGTPAQRVIEFFHGPEKGAPLRSLTRSALLHEGLRFPEIGLDAFWRCHPYLVHLLGAGPACHVAQPLYQRWLREGSLITHWDRMQAEDLYAGQRLSAAACMDRLDTFPMSTAEREVAQYALQLFILEWTRRHERRLGVSRPITASALYESFRDDPASDLSCLPPLHREWIRAAERALADGRSA